MAMKRALFAAACLSMISLNLRAQESPKSDASSSELTEIVVTGSRIARPEFDRLDPTTTVNAATFDTRGYLDVGQALSELPAFGVQPSSSANVQAGIGIAQSFVDLYSLGSQRTLVLVNGRRFVSSSTASVNGAGTNNPVGGPGQQVDLNTIPTELIDRVETISVGGAPIYGADAIAGTVNIILKKDFQGLTVDVQVGGSNDGDAYNYRLRTLMGQNFAGERGNVTVAADFTKTQGLVGTQRNIYAQDLGFLQPATPGPYQTVLLPANSVPQVNFGGIPLVDDVFLSPPSFGVPNTALGVTNAAGQLLAFGNSGSQLVPYNTGIQTGNPIFNVGGDGLRLSTVSNLLSPTERVNVDLLGNFKINDYVSAFSEGWFSETHATNLVSQPAYNGALFGGVGSAGSPFGNFVISINNPYLSATDRTLVQNALNNYAATLPLGGFAYQGNGQYPAWNTSQFYLARANLDLQSGYATATQVLARGVLGLNGDFTIAGRKFNWEIAANYGSSNGDQVSPSVVYQNEQNALNSTLNAAGQIVCAGNPVNAPTTTLSSTCAPLDPFGRGSPSLAAIQYITHLAATQSLNTQRDVTANLGGELFKLPAGAVKLAVGFENRRESADFNPDDFYTLVLGQQSQTALSGAYHTNEAYAESIVPIFSPQQDIPGLYNVELEGAARRVDNSIAGSATTWTEGLRFAPVPDVQFRANRTKSIRAPSITELFLPNASIGYFAADPCDHNFVNQGSAPATRAANCAAAGIDTTTFVSNAVNASVQGTTSGNTNLASETADSRTVGVVLRPRWVPRLNLSVDYMDIKLSRAIESLGLTNVLDACYDSTDYPDNPSCRTFTRNSTGQITNFHVGYINAGLLEFKGITAALDWAFDLPRDFGSVAWHVDYFDMKHLISQVGSASPNELAGQIGTSKTKGTIDTEYHRGPLSWDWQAQFLGPANFSNQNLPTTQNIWAVGHWWLINSTVAYKLTDRLTVRLIVDNVFDKLPPNSALADVQGQFFTATSAYFSGIIGRTYLLSANMHF